MHAGGYPLLIGYCLQQMMHAKFNLNQHYHPPYEREVWHFQRPNINLIERAIDNFNWEGAFFSYDMDEMVSFCNR